MTDYRGLPRPFPDVSDMPSHTGRGGPVPSMIGPAGQMLPPQAPTGQMQVFPWWLYEMPAAVDWEVNALNFTAVANAVTAVPNFLFKVSPQNVAVIKQLTITVQNSLASINLSVALLKNNAPIQGWSTITFPPVSATGVIVPFNGMIVRMDQNDQLTAQFTEAVGTTYTCSIQVRGWQVPVIEVKRLQQGVNY